MKLDSSEENVFWYSHIFIIFEALHHAWSIKRSYGNAIHIFNSLFDTVSINIDFSEKLKILLKKEPQSVHWPGVEIIVDSRILRKDSNKEYHGYLSDDLIQIHAFSNLALDEMLQGTDHDQKGMKHLEGVFLEKKFDSEKPKSAFFFKESVMFLSV